MFITEINTQYVHFRQFNLSNLLLKMYDHYVNDNKKYGPEFNMFLYLIFNMYENYNDYIDSLSTYEYNLLKQVLYKDAYSATRVAIAIDERIPELEPLIATSARNACDYAESVLKGRFELGESTIIKHPGYACEYARFVLKERFELGEAIIATDARYACEYAICVLKTRFELGENVILSSKFYKDEYIAYFPDCLTNSIGT